VSETLILEFTWTFQRTLECFVTVTSQGNDPYILPRISRADRPVSFIS